MNIREATDADFDAIWPIFKSIVSQGDTYAYDPETDRAQAYELWMKKPLRTYVAEHNGRIVGTYYIKPNQPALGAHVCNCGYMVSEEARGQGIATAMCLHSQEEARRLGFRAMQFNLVVATNEGAVRLWQKLGFEIVGRLPKAFRHAHLGFVDAYVMYKWLG
ncbi:MAG: GNAT family N-acetyltransferase [Caldilineae bacterium]|nr:MAG: GNAT family N-acetyltransferase [Caldilineae bacterium]